MTGQTVAWPLNAAAYERQLNQLIAGSKFQKPSSPEKAVLDLASSFR